ncbi:MAG: hypothetical protein R3F05_04130 [Planctomycetota bacterium]
MGRSGETPRRGGLRGAGSCRRGHAAPRGDGRSDDVPQALDAFARKLLEEGRRDIEGVDATDDLGRTIRAKDLPRAASALERALALAADDGLRREALAWRVRGAEEQGDHPAVIAAATRLLDLDKASALALAARGRARLATQDTAGARADLLLALPLVAAGKTPTRTAAWSKRWPPSASSLRAGETKPRSKRRRIVCAP